METAPNFSQPPTIPPVAVPPVLRPKKNKKPLLIFVAFLAILVIGIIVLRFSAQSILTEVVQEVPQISSPLNTPKDSSASSSFGNAFLDKPALHFELEDLGKNKIKFSEFLGKPIIISFWSTWNEASTDQLRILEEMKAQNSENIFHVITINSQEEYSYVANFIRRGNYNIPVLIDEKGSVTDQWQARVLPMTFFIDSQGVIKETYVGILNEEELTHRVERLFK
jgi:peroxiredoxin